MHWKGPFVVKGRINDVVYWVQKSPSHRPTAIHSDRLKAFNGPNPPTWWATTPKVQTDKHTDEPDEVDNTQEVPGPSSIYITHSGRTGRKPSNLP